MAFKNNVKRAAKIMFGDDSERDLPHPLKHCGSDMMHSEGWNKMRQMKILMIQSKMKKKLV